MKKPFFANYLESQLSNEEKKIIQGGRVRGDGGYSLISRPNTDRDLVPFADEQLIKEIMAQRVIQTRRYPSDDADIPVLNGVGVFPLPR